MRYRFPSTLSEFSSSSISDSESLARRARQKSFRTRQKERHEGKDSKARQARDERHETRRKRAKHRTKSTSTPDEPAVKRKSRHRKANASGSKTPVPEAASSEAANPAPSELPSSSIKRGLYFIYNNFVPHFGTGDSPMPTGSFSNAPGAYPRSFVQPEPVPPSSSVPGSDEDMSDDSGSSFATGSDSASFASSNDSSSDLSSSYDMPTGIREQSSYRPVPPPNPHCKHHFTDPHYQKRLDQERARVASAHRYAKEQEELKQKHEQERFRLEKERQQEERIRLEKEREEEEERKIREQERKKKEERQAHDKFVREALAAYEADRVRLAANLRKWMEADRRRKEWEQRQRAAREADEKEERERQKARKEEEKRNRQKAREEEDRKWFDAFGNRYRDRTSKTRSTHNRSHPYARSAKFGRSHSGLHFNPSDAQPAPAAMNVDPLVTHFQWYEAQWNDISSLSNKTPLTFTTIPWPLLTIPRTPADITAASVCEFMRHTKRGATVSTGKQLRFSMMKELKNWHPDKFMTRVLPRIVDDAEREVVRAAADVVQRALTDLKSTN